jgi:AraC-like DNA-binding protein
MGPSTLASWALLIQRTLAARGIDAEALFRQAKIDPAQLGDPDARYPVAALQRLWVLAAEATQDRCFGLEVGRAWHPTTFHALGYSAIASASLRQALGYLVRYSRVVSTGWRLDLVDHGAETTLKGTSLQQPGVALPQAMRLVVQAGVAATVTLCRNVKGASIGLLRVAFTQVDEACRHRLESFLQCPIAFGATDNALVFTRADLDDPLATTHPLLVRINEQALARYDAALHSPHVAERVRARLIPALPAGEFDLAEIARSLNMSLRAMQRKLAQEGTSYRKLLDETRRQLAEQYRSDSTLSASECAYLLGFAEASSFSRARRRWQGLARHRRSEGG